MSYFKKTIKIIIIVLYLDLTSGQYVQKVLDSVKNLWLKTDNVLFCNEFWYPKDFSGFKEKLQKEVIGQPFVTNNLIPIVEHHFSKPHPKDRDPLLLSFHGPSGVGKSFLAEILSSAIFIKNKHFFSLKSDLSDMNPVDHYKDEVNKIIDNSIKDCERSIFIFDDADSLPQGMIGSLSPFLNKKGKLNYGESIFVFIFQLGSPEMSAAALQLLNKGVKREQFNIQEFRDIIKNSAYDNKYENTFLSPINKIIPLLPLEKEHVISFIVADTLEDGYHASKSDIEKVLKELHYQKGTSFLSSGFKLVKSKIPIVLGRKTEL